MHLKPYSVKVKKNYYYEIVRDICNLSIGGQKYNLHVIDFRLK